MQATRTRRTRPGTLVGAVLAGALALGGLVGLAPTASAEQTGAPVAGSGIATWGVSDLLGTARNGFPSPAATPFIAPATYDATAKTVSFGDGGGTVAVDGSAALTFAGTTIHWATTGNSWLKIADPTVTFDADGDGTMTADVSYGTTTAGLWETATTVRGPERLTLVTLASTVDTTTYPTYPAALGEKDLAFVQDADSYSWTGLKGTWSQSLLDFLAGSSEPAIAPFAYASTVTNAIGSSGSTAGISRYPAEITLAVDRTVADTSVEASLNGDGIDIDVAGTGFLKTAPGLYVSLRERTPGDSAYTGGSLSMDAPTSWVSNSEADISGGAQGADAAIAEDGSFSTTIDLDAAAVAKLDLTKTYTVVTRKAHGQGSLPGNASQVTETPVDLASLKELTTTTATAAKVTPGNPAPVNVVVDAADGTPSGAVVLKDGDTQVGQGDLVNGATTIQVPGLPLGTTNLTVRYQGGNGFWHSADTVAVTVAKRTSTTGVSFVRKATSAVPGRIGVAVKDKYSALVPTGKVDVLLIKGGKVVKGIRGVTLSSTGKLLLTLPSTGKATWTVKVNYLGSAVHLPSTRSVQFTVTS